jgi:magnesium-transporting ATPase (P-type)
MITSCTLGLMLAAEPAEPDVMSRPPRHPKERLLGKMFYWRCFYVATIFVLFVLGSVAWINDLSDNENGAEEGLQHAIAFNTLVFCEVFYAFSCRYLHQSSFHPRVFFGNPLAWICALLVVSLQMLITYVSGLNTFFSMTPMTGVAWGICIFFAVIGFIIVEIEKYLGSKVKRFTKPFLDRIFGMCSRCRCTCLSRLSCCQDVDFEAGDDIPKHRVKINPKQKHGGGLRHILMKNLKEPV